MSDASSLLRSRNPIQSSAEVAQLPVSPETVAGPPPSETHVVYCSLQLSGPQKPQPPSATGAWQSVVFNGLLFRRVPTVTLIRGGTSARALVCDVSAD